MEFIHYDLNLSSNDVVKIELDKKANVKLMDYWNYQNYKQGKAHTYYGGVQQVSPARILAPHAGSWYLCIDLGLGGGRITSSVTVEKAKLS
ncbi:MAG: DUF1883 domain-containing protein [Blastocatellia bacterium]